MAQQTIANLESGLSVRTKINENFTEVYSGLHNMGWFLDEAALVAAHPTAEAGDMATVGKGATGPVVWAWDATTGAWENTASSGLVLSVFGRTGPVSAAGTDYAAFYDALGAAAAALGAALAGDAQHLLDFIHDDIALNSGHRGTAGTPHVTSSEKDNWNGKTTLVAVKADVDVASAISLKHSQGTDLGLDTGGTNPITAATLKGHVETVTGNPHAVTKTEVGLGNVENVALSTWTGSGNLVTLGTLTSLTVNGDITLSGAANRLVLPTGGGVLTIAFGDGDTGIYEPSDDSIFFKVDGAIHTKFTGSYIQFGADGGRSGVMMEVASATNPVFVPVRDDSDTGIGRAGADQLSLIAGGVEGIRVSATVSTVNKPNFVIGSDADGDIYYRASGVLARLAKGIAGYQLKMNAGATAPEWAEAIGTSAKNYNSDGVAGQMSYNSNYVYICVVTGTGGAGRWVRHAVESAGF